MDYEDERNQNSGRGARELVIWVMNCLAQVDPGSTPGILYGTLCTSRCDPEHKTGVNPEHHKV